MKLKRLLQVIIILLTLFMALFAPRIGSFFANMFNYESIDPDGSYAWLFIHHIVQALVILALIIVISRFTKIRFGFCLGDKEKGIQFVKKFTLYFFIYTVIAMIFTIVASGMVSFPYPINFRNVFGYLSFQLLMSGPSEEIIFRAFIMTILGLFIHKRILSNKISIVNLIAALIFMIAHIRFQFTPFSISYAPMQLAYSIGLGLVYGICYEQTKSIYYPMALHSISNIISVSAVIIVQSLFL